MRIEKLLKEAEEEKEREWKIREEEIALAGWTSFVPLRESGEWGVEGSAWNVDPPDAATTTPTRPGTSPRMPFFHPVACPDLVDKILPTIGEIIQGKLVFIFISGFILM